VGTHGRVRLSSIFEMLRKCAPGFHSQETDHYIRITYNGLTFPDLPRGEHGRRDGRAEIQRGVVKKMVRYLGIADCARMEIEALR
jgi:hypothetical protein